MLISSQMNAALNEQIGNEFRTSLQYVAIAAYFDCESLPELARFFYAQADEERMHAMRFLKFLVGASGEVEIPAIPEARGRFRSAEEAVQSALDGEITVSRQISALMKMAVQDEDHFTQSALQWFVTEQFEEVSTMETLLKMVQRAGEQGLLHVEEYLARRQPASPGREAMAPDMTSAGG